MHQGESEIKLSFHQSLYMSFIVFIGAFIYFSFRIVDGYWILLTIYVLYMGFTHGDIINRANHRIFGTFLGIAFGFFYIALLMDNSYLWIYLLPLIWFFLWYMNSISESYWIYACILTMFIPITFAVLEVEKFGITTVLTTRITCTAIGIILVLVGEYLFNRSYSVHGKIHNSIINIFEDTAYSIEHLTESFTNSIEVKIKDIPRMVRFVDKLNKLERLYITSKYEFTHKDETEIMYEHIFRNIFELNRHYREIICIVNNNDNNFTKEQIVLLHKLSKIISNKINSIYSPNYLNPKIECYKKVSSITDILIKTESKLNPLCFWCESINKIAKIVDNISKYMQNDNNITKWKNLKKLNF
ncbi:MAG: hypothetical protein GY756_20570 [bacterium]|nr:hypothetical protein [bacterium]